MAEQQRRFAIGYALAPKKRESFIQVSLVSLAQERGIDLIRIDTDKPLVDQGPFDCVLHKLYGDDWKKQLQEFSLKNPNARILDPPAAIERLHNRISMLQVVSELKVESHSNTFGIPKQIVIYDYETLGELQAWEPLKFPVIAKPLVADGSAKSHKMSLVFNQDGLNKSEQDQGSSSSIGQAQGSSSSTGQAQGSSSSTGQAQGLSFSVEARVMLPFLSILGFLLEVKSQDNNTLFEKHKAIIYSFVVAISIYMGTIFVGKKLGTEAIRPIQLLSGTIAAILLLLILVPNFGWLLLVLWVFLAAKMAWDYLPQLYHYLLSQEGGRVSNLLARLKTLNSTSVNGSQDDLV